MPGKIRWARVTVGPGERNRDKQVKVLCREGAFEKCFYTETLIAEGTVVNLQM